MKKKSVFLLILSSLLLFQSMWNVAAAFCTHEKGLEVSYSIQMHFGHHNSGHSLSVNKVSQLLSSHDDHSDHLPSFSPLILAEAVEHVPNIVSRPSERENKTDWRNLYTSPDLGFSPPPPMLTPL